MLVRFYPTLEQADRESLQDSTVVVIDVLRFASTVIAALEGGATRIIPVEDIETASRLVQPEDRKVKILAGEMRGLTVEGFDLGNSPVEFNSDTVGGKIVVLTTTNGSRAVAASSKADRILICSINNVGAVAKAVEGMEELIILCSGTEGRFAAEDILCGGMLLEALRKRVTRDSLDDAGRLALLLAETVGGDTEDFLRAVDHGRYLTSIGFERDVIHCASKNVSLMVPEVRQGAITA